MPIRHRIQSTVAEFIAAFVIAALIVVIPSPLLAQQKATAAKAAPVAEEEETAPTSKKPGDEGIKVHGHWIIDVKDKDGKLVGHRDFQNSLTDTNPLLLLLTGQMVPNAMAVQVFDGAGATYVMYPATTSTQKSALGLQCNGGAPGCNADLVAALVGAPIDANTPGFTGLKLTGQFTPTASISLSKVQTLLSTCMVSPLTQAITYVPVSPVSCAALNTSSNPGQFYFSQLTGTTLSTPLSVAAGQVVSVTVTLSFS